LFKKRGVPRDLFYYILCYDITYVMVFSATDMDSGCVLFKEKCPPGSFLLHVMCITCYAITYITLFSAPDMDSGCVLFKEKCHPGTWIAVSLSNNKVFLAPGVASDLVFWGSYVVAPYHQTINQGSMLWSQFSVIFAYFRRKNGVVSKNKVMINFFHNLALFWVKNAIFSPIFLVENI
jgi:hypothetical protein